MKRIITINPKWIVSSLMAALIIGMVSSLYAATPSSAHPPALEDGRPEFTATVQSAPKEQASIQMEETRLDSSYFSKHGQATGLEITADGLVLAGGENSGSYVSGVIESPLAFTTDIVPLWDVDVPENAEFILETRLSLNGDAWSNWVENPEAFYPVRDNQHSGNLIWVGNEQAALQFRVTLHNSKAGVSPRLKSLTLVFNNTSAGPTDGEIAGAMAARMSRASAADICPIKPDVVSRTDWGCPDGQNSPRRSPLYQPVTHIIIHQAETPNQLPPYQNWSGWVRSVWNYHANVLWWGDVGYNYIIDPNGTIYEGRAGGDDVVGIHDGINSGSMSIGFLGCYGDCDDPRLSEIDPPEAMLDSAARLMAWKLGQKEIDPYSNGPYGHWNDIPVIAGGQDVSWTTSPGSHLYAQLPNLRDDTADLLDSCQGQAGCAVEDVFFDQAEYTVGEPIYVTAAVIDSDGNPLGGANVEFDVSITPATQNLAAATSFTMDDLTGFYQGVYTDTQLAGDYLFAVTASDPAGAFECSGESSVTVKPDDSSLPACQITDVDFDKDAYDIGDTINLTATVKDQSGNALNEATVTAAITRPDIGLDNIDFAGSGPYTGSYANTDIDGIYQFKISAGDPTHSIFSACTVEKAVTVNPPITACSIAASVNPTSVISGNSVDLLAQVRLNNNPVTDANVVAQVTTPDGSHITSTMASGGDGSYTHSFSDTAAPGPYEFLATAGGEGFEACQDDVPFSVQPAITGTTVIIEPAAMQLCQGSGNLVTTKVTVADVTSLQGSSFKLNFDPAVVNVVDADPGTPDIVEIRAGDDLGDSLLVTAANEVKDGTVNFGFALSKSFDGTVVLAEIDWEPVAAGQSALTFDEIKLSNPDGVAIQSQVVNGAIKVEDCTGTIVAGRIQLQGRTNHSGVVVSNDQANQTQTNNEGFFSIAGSNVIGFKLPGFLSAQANMQIKLGQISGNGPINLGVITLPAGDANGDNIIDIFDLAYLGAHYETNDALADFNGDGLVDIFDLAMAAKNYEQKGPLIWPDGP